MARSLIRGTQIGDNSLTGADLHYRTGIYDETHTYPPESRVFWNGYIYTTTATVSGGDAGDLSNAPDVSSDWVYVPSGTLYHADLLDTDINGHPITAISGLQYELDSKAPASGLDNHIIDYNNPHNVTKDQVGLGNVDNTSDLDKPISTATQDALDDKLDVDGKAADSDLLDGYDSTYFATSSGMNDHIHDYNNPHQVTKSQVGLGNVDNTSDLDKPISTATQDALDDKLDVDGKAADSELLDGKDSSEFADANHSHYLGQLINVTIVPSGLVNKGYLGYDQSNNVWTNMPEPEGTTVHNDLTGRDAQDAHPILAITGLQDELDSKATVSGLDDHISDYNNPHQVTKDQVGLGNVDNTSDLDKPISTATQGALDGKLDVNGKAADSDLLDGMDSSEFATASGLGDHLTDYNNPHQVTKDQVGLSNVDNTSDLDKPISTATQTALDDKLDIDGKAADSDLLDGMDSTEFATTSGLNDHLTDYNNPHQVTKDQVGLGNVDNTSDLDKPISTATQTALDDKLDIDGKAADSELLDGMDSTEFATTSGLNNHLTDYNNPHQVTKDQVGLGNVDNTADMDKPISTATQTALDNKLDINGKAADSDLLDGKDSSEFATVSGLDDHLTDYNNPHQVTKDQVGLSNVDNTSDLDKPISTATQDALDDKLDIDGKAADSDLLDGKDSTEFATASGLSDHLTDYNNPHQVTKAQVGLGNVDNTSDMDKPISTATQNALDDKLDVDGKAADSDLLDGKDSSEFATTSGLQDHINDHNNPHQVTKDQVGLGNVDNTSDLDKPISTATQTALDDKLGKTEKAADSELLDGHDSTYFAEVNHTHELNDLSDVDVSSAQDGQLLSYDSASDDWIPKTFTGGTSVHNDLTGRDVADAHPISAITSLSGTLASKMHWMGAWKESDYKLNDVVRDGEWTMVALNDTSERAAPQPIGDPYYLFDAELVNISHPAAAYISVGQRYTITTPGWLLGCRIYAVGTENYMYRIVVVDRTDPSHVVHRIGREFSVSVAGWRDAALQPVVLKTGSIIDLLLVIYNRSSEDITFNIDYDYRTPVPDIAPSNGEISHSNRSTDELKVSKTDYNGVDRTADLAQLGVGDTIKQSSVVWSIENIQDDGSYITFTVSPDTQLPNDGVYTFTFTTYLDNTIDYGKLDDHWISNSHVSGLYEVNGISSPTVNDNAYPIDIKVQPMYLSDDWDILAYCNATGGSVGGAVYLNDLLDVDVPSPEGGDRLAWDPEEEKWMAKRSLSALSIMEFEYTFDLPPNSVPDPKYISYDNSDPSLVTMLYMHERDVSGADLSLFFAEMKAGDWLNIHRKRNTDSYAKYDVIAAPTKNGNIWEVPVEYYDHNYTFSDGNRVRVFWRVQGQDTDVYREPMGSGAHHGGKLAKGSGALDVDIEGGRGIVVDATTDPFKVERTDVIWPDQTITLTPTATDTQEIHMIYIDANAVVHAEPVQNITYKLIYDYIRLGWAEIGQNQIVNVVDAPYIIGQSASNLSDLFYSLRDSSKAQGLRLMPCLDILGFYCNGGKLLVPGINWYNDRKDQNIMTVPPDGDITNPIKFQVFNKYAKSVMAGQTLIPKYYDDDGNMTPLTGDEAVIHYVFYSTSGFSIQLGQHNYANYPTAFKSLVYDMETFDFAPGAGITGRSTLVAQIIISKQAYDFNDKTIANIISTINDETGHVVSPIDLTLAPQYKLRTIAAKPINAGDELSMDVNGNVQPYPATGGEGFSEFTSDNVVVHAAIFLNNTNNQGIIAWAKDGTAAVYFKTAQGNPDGSISYSGLSAVTTNGVPKSIRMCKIDNNRAGFIFVDNNGVYLGVVGNNGIGTPPSLGTRQQLVSSSSATTADVVWDPTNSNLIGVYSEDGTATRNRYCKISGNDVQSPPYNAIWMMNGRVVRCTTEGNNVIVVSIYNGTSRWREAAWNKPFWGTGRYDDQTGEVQVSDCDVHCGLQVEGGVILAQFEKGGDIKTYQASYSSSNSINTPTQYGNTLSGKVGDLLKTDSGTGYSLILTSANKVEIYEGTLTGTYQKVYTSNFTVEVNNDSLNALMFGSIFAVGIGYEFVDSRKVFLINSSATRTDHFIGVATHDAAQGSYVSVDIALPIIVLQRSYPEGTMYEYGPYKYQVITHNQAVIIIEATIMMT